MGFRASQTCLPLTDSLRQVTETLSIFLYVNEDYNIYFIAKAQLNYVWKIFLHDFISIDMDSGGI